MKYPCLRLTFALAAFSLVLPLFAQMSAQMPAQQTPAVVGSTVTGRVLCSDTNAPARFAKVVLQPTTPGHAGEDLIKNLQSFMQKAAAKSGDPAKPMSAQQKQAITAAESGMNHMFDMMNASTVGLDGRFSFAGVKPGAYYVHAIYPGYIDPLSQFSDADFASADPAMRAKIAQTTAQTPIVTVNGTNSAHVDLLLHRGATVSGRITYSDGSPAIGWNLSVVKPGSPDDAMGAASVQMTQALAMSGAAQVFKTDDRGRYRITGLPAGNYVVRAVLAAPPVGISPSNTADGGSGIFLTAYSGNAFDRAAAKSVSLTAGQNLPDIDIAISTGSLHDIVGHVYAKSDGHTLNVGKVSLTSKADPALRLWAAIRDDGSFHFQYLPAGLTYTLTVEDAADGRSTPGKANLLGISIPHTTVLRKYGTAATDVPLEDGDVDSVRLTVVQTNWTPPAAGSCTPCTGITPGDLVNGVLGVDSSGKTKQ